MSRALLAGQRNRGDHMRLGIGHALRGPQLGRITGRNAHDALVELHLLAAVEHFAFVEIADHAVVLGQCRLDFAGCFQFVVHGLHDFAVFGIGELLLDPLRRDIERRHHGLERERDFGRRDARFRNGAIQDVSEAIRRIHQQLSDHHAPDIVEAFRRSDHAALEVIIAR